MNTTTEAAALAHRFENVENRAEFARTYRVPGGAAMIYQHITARKPISIEAAICYAKGFRCSLNEISADRAREIAEAAKMLTDATNTHQVNEKASIYEFLPDVIMQTLEIMRELSPDEQQTVLKHARFVQSESSERPQNSTQRASQ